MQVSCLRTAERVRKGRGCYSPKSQNGFKDTIEHQKCFYKQLKIVSQCHFQVSFERDTKITKLSEYLNFQKAGEEIPHRHILNGNLWKSWSGMVELNSCLTHGQENPRVHGQAAPFLVARLWARLYLEMLTTIPRIRYTLVFSDHSFLSFVNSLPSMKFCLVFELS